MKKITAILAIVLAIFGINASLATHNVYADNICDHLTPGSEVYKANGCGGEAAANLTDVVINIINGVIGVLALVAVIVVVIGGVNYMTSAGDAGKVQKAKNTILYAVIGLTICVLAFAIVNFVISRILKGEGGGEETEGPINGGGPVSSLVITDSNFAEKFLQS